jgi:hypothetical protein
VKWIQVEGITVEAVFFIERKKGVILFNGRPFLPKEEKRRTGRCRAHGATPGGIRSSPTPPDRREKGIS